MGKSRKQKRALRVRQKMADRQATVRQIRGYINELDRMQERLEAGLPLYPQSTKEK